MTLRILALNWRDARSPQAGGADYHLHEVLRRLVRRGHSATLIASQFAGERGSPFETIDGYDVHRVGSWWNAHLTVPRAAKRLLKERPFDVVIDDVNKIPFFAPSWSQVPVIAFFHHLLGKSAFVETNPAFAAGILLCERRIPHVYQNTRSLVVSRSTSEELQELGLPLNHQRIVPPGFDHEIHYSESASRSTAPTIVAISRLKRYKRIDRAIHALAHLRKNQPEVTMKVIGDGDQRARLESLAKRLGQPVEFLGQIDDIKKAQVLREATFLINPSMKEGWGIAVVEAMASATIPVVSDVGGHRDSAVEGAAVRVSNETPSAYADALAKLIGNPALAESMRQRGIQWAQRFRWDHVVDGVEQLFGEAVKKSPPQETSTGCRSLTAPIERGMP